MQVNIVGFALHDDVKFAERAELKNGAHFDATNSEELDDAIAKAVQVPYRVLYQDGNEVEAGNIDDDPVDLPPGAYTVVVLTDPEQRFESVVVESGGTVEIKLK